MRKSLILGLPLLLLAAASGAWVLSHPADPVASAKQRMARQDMRGAELYLRQAVREHPQDALAAFLLGRVDLATDQPEAAELEFRRARDHGYDPAAIVLPLGQAYLQQRHFEAALHDFDPALAAAGRVSASQRADTLTILAAAKISLGDEAGAAATIAQAEAANPGARETLLTAARIALIRGDLAGAARRTDAVLAREPGQPDALLLRGELAMQRGEPAAALSGAQAVLAAAPNRLDAKLAEARALAALGRTDAARAAIALVLRAKPRDVGANFLAAMLAIKAADYLAADAALTRINPVIAKMPRGLYLLAIAKLGVGQPAQAAEAAVKFLSQSPDDPGGRKLMAFIDLARHRPDDALALLREGAHPDADTLDLIGRAQAMSGDMAAAAGSFAEASRLAPADTAILNRLAAAHLDTGDDAAADAELRRSLQIAPGQRAAGEAMVPTALGRGDLAGAAAAVAGLRAAMGDTEPVGVLAAQVRMAGLDMAGAETQLRDVLRRFPDSRPATLMLVRILSLRGDPDAAAAVLADRQHRHPDDAATLAALLPILAAGGHADRAVAAAEAAHLAAPNDVAITADLAGAYVRAGQMPRALALLDRAGVQSPELGLRRAHLLAAAGRSEDAERAYRDGLRQNPTDQPARAALAALLTRAKRADDARALLREGLALTPGNALLLGAMVGTDLQQGGVTQALARAETLRADPQNRPAANSLAGDVWLTAGDMGQAGRSYLTAYHTTPSGDLAAKAASALAATGQPDPAIALLTAWIAGHSDDIAARYVLSAICIAAHRWPQAAEQLHAILAVRHNDTAALNNLAWVSQVQGDPAQALTLAQRAYFQAPVPEVADTLGWILLLGGDPARALPMLALAATNPDPSASASAAYHYGTALAALGRHGEARDQLQKAVASTAVFNERNDARGALQHLVPGQ